MLNQYNLCITTLRNQVDRLLQAKELDTKEMLEQKAQEDSRRDREETQDACDILMEKIEVLLMSNDVEKDGKVDHTKRFR